MSTTYHEGQEVRPKQDNKYTKKSKIVLLEEAEDARQVVDKEINDYIIGLGFKKVKNNKYTLDVGFKLFEMLVLDAHIFISQIDEITGKERALLHLYRYENVADLDYVIKRLSSLEPFITGGYFS